MDHLHAFRLYRGTSVERGGFSPPAESYGMKFWDTDEDTIYWWDGTQWVLPSPRTDDWVGLNAAGAASWQPDNVALLRGGQITEYADPDDAFTAADTAGDVILIPPGTWTLSALHTLTDVSVVGLGGGPEDCVLQSTVDAAGNLVELSSSGTAYGFSIDWNVANSNNTLVGLYIGAGCCAHRCIVDVDITAGAGAANAIAGSGGALLRQCIGYGHAQNGIARGFNAASDCNIMECEGRAETDGTGNAYGIGCPGAGENVPLRNCLGVGLATGAGDGYGLRFGTGTSPDVYVAHCYFSGDTADIWGYFSPGYFYSVRYDSATLTNGSTITHLAGDRAGKARDETITGVWIFDEEITQAEQAGDPGGPGAGYGRIYPKDDGGQTKFYFMDDAANVYEIQGIVENLTVTVKAAGGNFTAIQDAIDWFKNWIIKGACKIDCDANAYDEAVVFSDLLIVPGSTLELEGDTRVLAGLTYIDTADGNPNGLANGGDGAVALALNVGLDQITVGCGVANPDFDADGWGNGDTVWVLGDDWNVYERTINSISPGGAGNHVIEITVALPGGVDLGTDGTAVCLVPNRSVARTVAGACIEVVSVKGVLIDGWDLDTASGDDCHGLYVHDGGKCTAENVASDAEDYAFNTQAANSYLDCDNTTCSAWSCSRGSHAGSSSEMSANYCFSVNCTLGFYGLMRSYLNATEAQASRCTYSFYAAQFSLVYPHTATSIRATNTAYTSDSVSEVYAAGTIATNSNNAADYSPNPAGVGWAESAAHGVMYSS